MSTASLASDLGVTRIRLGTARLDSDIESAITAADLEYTMETASTFTLALIDPEKTIVRSGRLVKGLKASIRRSDSPGYDTFILVSAEKSGNNFSFVFEDETIYRLRQRGGIKKATRGQVTRVEFAYSLVRELTHPTVPFYSPEIYDKQPIKWSDEVARLDDTAGKDPVDDAGKPYGFSKQENVTVKGQAASETQRKNIAFVLKIGVKMKAPKLTMTAAVASFIVESNAQGSWGGTANLEKAARQFYLGPNADNVGGAISYYASTRTSSMAKIIMFVRKNSSEAQGDIYRKREDEAYKAVNLYLGSDRFNYRGSLKRVRTEKKARYEFIRGNPDDPDQDEDSWTCLRRLADEVKWRCFVYRGTVYFIDDQELVKKYPVATINEMNPGIFSIDYSVDATTNKVRTDELTVRAAAERWGAAPGDVVRVTGQGPDIDSRPWLVFSFRRSMFDKVADITLRSPQPSAPEPPPEIITTKVHIDSGDPVDEVGALRQKIVDVAKAQLPRAGRDFHYRNMRPIPATLRQSPVLTDCSGFVKMVYREAGAPDPNGTNYDGNAFTGTMWDHGQPVAKPKPGDLVFYDPVHAFRGHVALVINDTECVSHGSEGGPRRVSFNYRTPKGFRTYRLEDA